MFLKKIKKRTVTKKPCVEHHPAPNKKGTNVQAKRPTFVSVSYDVLLKSRSAFLLAVFPVLCAAPLEQGPSLLRTLYGFPY